VALEKLPRTKSWKRCGFPKFFSCSKPLWAIVFIMFGKSTVTGTQISFDLRDDRI